MAGGHDAMYICLQPEKSVKIDSAKYFELVTISYLIIEKNYKTMSCSTGWLRVIENFFINV